MTPNAGCDYPPLVFRRYGDQYFLFQVWPAASTTGRTLSESRGEREIERNLAANSSAGKMAGNVTRNVSQAEDLAQDVFIQLFRKINTFRGESSFATWLHRLTVNQVLMHFRKPTVKTEQTTEDGTTPVRIASGTENPGKMSVIDRISLEDAIRQLPNGYRTVFILHDVEGYEHAQIGQMLGCAVGTSKSQLHKARMRLRSLLSKRITSRRHTHQKSRTALIRKLQPQLA